MYEKRCTTCQSALPQGAPGNRCPKCLLALGLDREAQDWQGEPLATFHVGPHEPHDRHIGRYKLLQQIGEGGCGVVYMAEQEEPVRRRVALKVIKLGMDTKNVVARFEAERQALAMMDHPNIARVFDGGATDQGRPFFVMELVRGIKITEYCDQHQLSMTERLELFMKICQAVQHAHQKGIIHRDLKPSNILVTVNDGVAVPKVIDFGVAKATEQRLTDKTIFTEFHAFVGTPAYMSPEQAEMSSLDIDTRSDIYSLGVLLYELLTGRTPFDHADLVQSGIDEMRRTIREKEPQRPSTRLCILTNDELTSTAKHRRIEPPRLITTLLGDLDWIVMKALEKDRTRRYDTANGFAMDILRYLNNEPVFARPPTSAYRFQKLVRRNRVAFTAAAGIALSLTCGLALSTWLYAKERVARQRAVTAELEEARSRRKAEEANATEARLRLEAESARANEAILRSEAERARTNEAIIRAQFEVAERTAQAQVTQLADLLLQLGKLEEAEEFIRKGLVMFRGNSEDQSLAIAASLNNLGKVLIRQGKNLPEAESACREALALRRKLLGEEHLEVANSLDRLAMVLSLQGKTEEAALVNQELLAMRRKLLGNEHIEVANSLLNLGWLLRLANQFPQAEPIYNEALSISSKLLGNEHPYVHSVLHVFSDGLLENHRAAEAEPLVRECLRIRQKKIPNEIETFSTQNLLGAVLLEQGKYSEAEPLLLDSWKALNERMTTEPTQSKANVQLALERLIRLYDTTGQLLQANARRSELNLLLAAP